MAKTSKKEEAKRELAQRLGQPVEKLLTREELAKRWKTSPKALSVNLSAHPPFYSKGARSKAYYPLWWIEEHESDGKVKGAQGYLQGAQAWPPPLPPPPPTDTALRDRTRDSLSNLADQDYARRVAEGDWN